MRGPLRAKRPKKLQGLEINTGKLRTWLRAKSSFSRFFVEKNSSEKLSRLARALELEALGVKN